MSRRCRPGVQDVRCKNNKFHIFDGNEPPGDSPFPDPFVPPPKPTPEPPKPIPRGRTGSIGLSIPQILAISSGSVVAAGLLSQTTKIGSETVIETIPEVEMTAISEEAVLSTTTGYSAISQAGLSGGGEAWAGLTTEVGGGELATLSAVGEGASAIVPFEIGGEALALEATTAVAGATSGLGLGIGAIALAAPLTVYALIELTKAGLFDWYTNPGVMPEGPPYIQPPDVFASQQERMDYMIRKDESDAQYYADIQQKHDDAFNKIVDYAKTNGDPIPSNDKEANDYLTSKQTEQLQAVQSVAKANGDPIPVDIASANDYASSHSAPAPESTPAPAP